MKVSGMRLGRIGVALLPGALAALLGRPALAQTTVDDDFTMATVNTSGAHVLSLDASPMQWISSGGACLTAQPKGAVLNGIPACVGLPYYNNGTVTQVLPLVLNGVGQVQVGGQNGYLGDSPSGGTNPPDTNSGQTPDGYGNGALRLTNGKDPNSSLHTLQQHGAIVSSTSFDATAGIQIIFKAIAYAGDGGGTGKDGADGMSFFLIDASKWNNIYAGFPSGYPTAVGTGLDLMQALQPATGATGGSLGYDCSNTNPVNDGLVGAYIGLGVDEYGNGLNVSDNSATGVPASGWGSGDFQWNRIGLRGRGNVNYPELSAAQPTWYPASGLTLAQQSAAVQNTCITGTYWNYSNPVLPVNTGLTTNNGNTLYDYAALQTPTGAYAAGVIPLTGPHAQQIATEGAATRGAAVPIYYNLKITNSGKLSFSYSYPGYSQQVLSNVDITNANGLLPSNVYFGFTASTGGADNVHEILCFKAMPADQSDSSAAVTTPDSDVLTNVQLFEPTFHTNNWWGELAAYSFSLSGNILNVTVPSNWNASCVLSGTYCTSSVVSDYSQTSGTASKLTAETWNTASSGTGRQILTWNDSTNAGVAFEWSSLSANEQTNLGAQSLLNYLRGNRCDETGVVCGGVTGSLYRVRTGLLGDIIHSSPMVVGNPTKGYPAIFTDYLYSSATQPENATGAQTYPTFASNNAGRQIVAYTGANDGMLHGFRAGSYQSNGTLDTSTNDGTEILAYVPSVVVNAINSNVDAGYNYASVNYAHSYFVDGPPAAGDLFYCSTATSPNCAWHTWLVGGLGAGGTPGLYALDVTNPTNQSSGANFQESNAASLVIHEWTPSTLTCSNTTTATPCGAYMQNISGRPAIGRFHNGSWGIAIGNGVPEPIQITASISGSVMTVTAGNSLAAGQYVTGAGLASGVKITSQVTPLLAGETTGGTGRYNLSASTTVALENMATYAIATSTNGDAGIYLLLVNPSYGPFGSSGTSGSGVSVYFLDTGYGMSRDPLGQGHPNGIAYVSLADMDHDGIVDYAYAGDVFGNVWRFDLTGNSASSWLVSKYGKSVATPLFSTYSSGNLQPITSAVTQATIAMGAGRYGALVTFGTGMETPLSLSTTPLNNYASGQQAMYGVWDWDMTAWNAFGPEQPMATLAYTPSVPSFGASNLTQQTENVLPGATYGSISANTITWCSSNPCASGSTVGWTLLLNSSTSEQIIYNPVVLDGILEFNTVIPPSNTLYSCSDSTPTGYSVFANPVTGGSFSTSVLLNSSGVPMTVGGNPTSMINDNAAGSASYINAGGNSYEISCSATGSCKTHQVQPPSSSVGHRVTWTELR